MGKSKGKAQVTDYSMSIDFSFGVSMDAVTGIYLDKKVLWEGTADESQAININLPQLFGGPKKEGGAVGRVFVLLGEDDQVMPESLAAKVGLTSATCPAYRGLTRLFFTGVEARAAHTVVTAKYLLSTAASLGGFLWGTNNPYIKPVSARGIRSSKGLNPLKAIISKTVDGKLVRASNPIHMVYECLTNTEWGMAEDPAEIDEEMFEAAADTIYDEEFGLALLWNRQSEIKAFIQEILDHIQADLYEDLQTGLWSIKLRRNDYDIETLPQITPDNATISGFGRRLLAETINEIVVSWTNPVNEEATSLSAIDDANVANQGKVVSDQRNYYGIRWASLAAEVLQRDLRAATAQLASCTAEVDRSLWSKVKPGAVFAVPWAEDGINLTLIMRVSGDIDYGKPGSATIKVPLIEDVWSLLRPEYGTPTTSWEDPATLAAPVNEVQIFTLPAQMAANVEALGDLTYPEVGAGVLAASPNDDTQALDLFAWAADTSGVAGFADAGWKSFSAVIEISEALAAEPYTDLYEFPSEATKLAPVENSFVFLGEGGDDDIEIALVEGPTDDEDGWVLRRGVLDTVPRAWPTGTKAWFARPTAKVSDDIIRSAGETLRYKLLTKTSLDTLALSDADEINFVLTERPHLPLRPANVKVNDTAFGPLNVSGATDIAITWANRNRLLETTQILGWDEGSVVPEYKQRTIVTLRNAADSSVIMQWLGLWTETELTFPKAYLERYNQVWVEVSSERSGFDSLQAHRILLTGLPNNVSGSPAPEAPAPGEPPPPSAAPADGTFTAAGGYVAGAGGTRVPTVVVSGTADDETATDVVVRTRPNGGGAWSQISTAIPESGSVRVEIRGLAPDTIYNVAVAYLTPLGLGEFRTLSNVTTGSLIAGDTVAVGGRDSTTILSDFDEAAQTANDSAEALLSSILSRVEMNERRRLENYIGVIPASHELAKLIAVEAATRAEALLTEASDRVDAISALATSVATDILAEATARGAAITTEATTRQSADDSLAATIVTLTASVTSDLATLSAAVSSETSARASGDAAEASSRNTLAAQMRGSYTGTDIGSVTTGLFYNERIARATADTALSQAITLLSAGAGEQFDPLTIWYFDASVESWTGNGSPAVTDGWLRPANHGSDPYVASPTGINGDAARYSQVRLRVRKYGTITWEGHLWWREASDSTWDSARRVDLAEPTWDANDIGLIVVSPEWTGTIDRIRIDLSTVQDASDWLEIDWVSVGRPSPGASSAALLEEQTVRASADSALASDLTVLEARVGTTEADIATEATARATADSAEVTSRQALAVKMTGLSDPSSSTLGTLTSGLVYEEKTARVSADGALSSSISTVQANVDTVSAAVTAEATARASADTSLASSISSVSAVANARNRSYRQTTAPSSGMVSGDLWFDSDDNNKTYRYDGSSWVATDDTRLATNAAAITSEATARATADTALASDITTVSAVANARNRSYRQTTAPASGMVSGDIWFDSNDNNKAYRYDGASWVATDDTRLATNAAAITSEATARATADSAEVTSRQALSTKLTGLADPSSATLAGLSSGLIYDERTARSSADGAMATDISVLQASASTNSAAITTEATARAAADSAAASRIDTIYAQAGSYPLYNLDPSHQAWPVANSLPTNVVTSGTIPTTTRITSGQIYGEKALKGAGVSTASTGYQRQAATMKPASAPADGYVVCEWEITLNAGDLKRAGFEYRLNYASGYKRATVHLFDQHPSPTVGATYRGTKLVALTDVASSGAVVDQTDYLWLNNSTLFTTQANSAKTLTFQRVSWRAATSEEVAAGVTLPTVSAAVTAEATTRASADTSLASSISSVSAVANARNRSYRQTTAPASGMVSGDLWFDSDDNNKTYRYDGSSWVAADDTRLTTNAAAITSEATARATADSAEVTSRQALSTKLTGLADPSSATLAGLSSGLIYEERTARSTAVSTVTTDLATVTATVAGHTSSIATQSTAIADINGRLSATWGVTLNVDNRVSGIKLQTSGGGGTAISTFDVLADKFRVFNGSANVPAFEVSGGKAYVSGDLVRTASLENKAAHAVSAVYADSTVVQVGQSTSTNFGNQLLYLSVTTEGYPVEVEVFLTDDCNASQQYYYYLHVDTTFNVVGTAETQHHTEWPQRIGSGLITKQARAFKLLITGLAAGVHEFRIYLRNTSGTSMSVTSRYLSVVEMKKSV